MKSLDLGCGGALRGPEGWDLYGIDLVDKGPNVKVADLVWEPIPFADDTFELVTAYDFIEHIPMLVYKPVIQVDTLFFTPPLKGMQRRNPVIELFNEIYRVLKDGGEFYCQVPVYPHLACFQDPTHVSVWTPESLNYFSGDYYGFHDDYGHTSRFTKQTVEVGAMHMAFRFKALKSLGDSPYLVNY